MRAGRTGNQKYSRPVMALRIELWGPPLAPLTGGNLYDRILVETLRNRGHQVTVREFAGDGSETPAASSRADVIVQDGLLHREFLRRNADWTGRRPRIVALVHHPQSSEPERGEAELARLRIEERAYLRTVDGVLSPSWASVDAARRLAGRQLPAAVVPPGRDRLAGAALPALPGPEEIRARARGPLRIAHVANVIPRKRLLELLEALATVPQWTLAVAGREDPDPAYAAAARRRAAAPDLANRVRFRGPLGPAALTELLRDSVLLAVPSTHEGFGIVYLEGFAFGLPALAAASGGAAEIVSEGENRLVDPRGRVKERFAADRRPPRDSRRRSRPAGGDGAARRRAPPESSHLGRERRRGRGPLHAPRSERMERPGSVMGL